MTGSRLKGNHGLPQKVQPGKPEKQAKDDRGSCLEGMIAYPKAAYIWSGILEYQMRFAVSQV